MNSKLKVNLLRYTPDAEKLIASAAKLCYSPVGIDQIEEKLSQEKTQKFLDMLLNIGHESPIEHVSFTFGLEGVSRVLTHQLVRHRIGASYSQQSQRYVKLEQFNYIIPPAIESIPSAKDKFLQAMKEDQEYYDELTETLYDKHIEEFRKKGYKDKQAEKIAEKRAIEDARYVFPNACETKIVVTMNARALFNFFKHRCCNRAQWEIRELATKMLKEVKKVSPILFKNIGPECLNGPCPEGSMTCGEVNEVRKKFKEL